MHCMLSRTALFRACCSFEPLHAETRAELHAWWVILTCMLSLPTLMRMAASCVSVGMREASMVAAVSPTLSTPVIRACKTAHKPIHSSCLALSGHAKTQSAPVS